MAANAPAAANHAGSNTSPARMVNACGQFICRVEDHPAWQVHTNIFGLTRKAYTVGGNLSISRRCIVFKGATSLERLMGVMRVLLGHQPPQPTLQLLVLSAGVGRCMSVNRGCQLERGLDYVPWVRVASRIEELCNVVVFYITHWRAMEAALGLEPWPDAPRSAAVSVTRRGTLMLRITWDGTAWEGSFCETAAAIARFVAQMV
jgi:hypothetical protein